MTLKLFTVLCWTIFIIISTPAWSQYSNAPEKVSLQLKWTHQFQFAGYYAAKEQGYYANAGLDVEFIERGVGIEPVEQVLSGKAQYGISDSSIVSEFAKGTQIKALAAIFQHSPLVFISKKSSLITSPFEMKGKRIMLQDYEAAYAPLRAFFVGAGFNEGDYIYVKHTYDNGSLIRDEVDIISNYLTDAPYYFQQQGVEINIINPQDYGVDFYGDILFASTQETIDHPNRAQRFKQATIKGWYYALAHQEELVQLIHDEYKSKLSLNALRYEAKEIAKLISADTVPLGTIEAGRLLRTAEVYARLYKNKTLNINDIRSFLLPEDNIHRIKLTHQEQEWLKEHPNLTFTGDPDWLPYEAFDDEGNYSGIVADHLKVIEQHSGIKFNIVPTKTWQESIAKVRAGEIDIISETVDSSLTDKMAFTKPYLSSPIIIVMNDEQAYVNSITQISDKKIALIRGYGYIEHITDAYPELDYHWIDSLPEGLEAVSSGEADALLSTLAHTSYAIPKSGIQNVKIVGKTEFTNNLAFGVKKEYAPILIPLLNKAFDSITEQEKKQIFDKWGKVAFASQTNYWVVIQVTLGLLLLLSIVLYWNRTLRLQVVARKQAEISLTLSESRLQEAQRYAHIGHWDLLRDSTIATWSEQMYVIFGLPPEVESGPETLCDILHTSDCPRFMESLQYSFETGEEHHVEYRIRRRNDNEERWIECRGKPVIGNDGLVERISGFIQDITERKQIEKSVAEKEEQLLSFYKSDIVGLAITSPDKGWLRINNCLCEMLEYSEEKLRSMTWAELTHPDDLAADVEQFSRLLANDIDTYSLEKRFISRTGKVIPINLVVNSVRKPDGQVNYVTAMVQDISELKDTEQQLLIAATAFESQEGMMVTDANSVILRVNKAFTTITGYNAEELLGKNPTVLSSGQHDALFYIAMWKEINTDDYWEGEIWNKRKNGEVYPEKLTITAVKDSNDNITNYVATVIDITLSKQAEQEIEGLAYYDPLTHLPNRRLMIDRINHAMAASARTGNEGALLFLDLDHFKDINDTLGHDMGDLLLQQVAERLTSCLREGDTVSRFGGDEFVVLLEGLSPQSIEAAAQAEDIANKILSSINMPYQLINHHYNSSTSIGISLFVDHKSDVDELLKQADIALYQAKDDGRNALRFFDPQMQAKITERVALEKELKQAIDQHQFQLYYQIQLDDSLHPQGAEALIRWDHPERGLVSPIDFIPVAEQNGAILAIGQWVLDTACTQLKVWQRDEATRDLTLSVNVSAKQFRQAGFTSQIMMAVQQHAINPARLKLELTESLLLDDVESTIAKMNTLAKIGIQFSLDDFGTGYSSLQYLKRLPLDQLKIDKSFVDDIVSGNNDQAIVRTIIAMAHSLGLSVIAEGVETKEQQERLLEEGCIHYQGYLFSRPVPIDEFEALLGKTD